MRNLVISMLAAAAIASSASASQTLAVPGMAAPQARAESELLADWVSRIAGPGALSCGLDRDCAKDAISSAKPFWVSFPEDASFDYRGWSGFARNAKGQMWMVVQDSGSRERPRVVTVVTCKNLLVAAQTMDCERIDAIPALWKGESLRQPVLRPCRQ